MIWEKKKNPAEVQPPEMPGMESVPSNAEPVEPARSSRARLVFQLLVILALLLVSFSGPFLQGIGDYLVLEDPPEKADLIVVLAGSPAVRGLAAADYYNQDLAPKLYLSRGGLEKKRPAGRLGRFGFDRHRVLGLDQSHLDGQRRSRIRRDYGYAIRGKYPGGSQAFCRVP